MCINWDVWERKSDSLIRRDVWMQREGKKSNSYMCVCVCVCVEVLPRGQSSWGTIIIPFSASPAPERDSINIWWEWEREGGENRTSCHFESQRLKMPKRSEAFTPYVCKSIFIATAAIFICYLLIRDWDMLHLEILAAAAAAAAGSLNPHRNSKPFISLTDSAPVIFRNQLELVPALSHVLRGLVGH